MRTLRRMLSSLLLLINIALAVLGAYRFWGQRGAMAALAVVCAMAAGTEAYSTFVMVPAFAAERAEAKQRLAEQAEQHRAYVATCVWNDAGMVTRCDESMNPDRADGGVR